MLSASDQNLLEVILDSWDRNNQILVNLLQALPEGGLAARAMPGSPSVAEMFTHLHYVRVVFLSEDAPALAIEVPTQEWNGEQSRDEMAEALKTSASAVRDAVRRLIESGAEMDVHFDHPVLYLQQMIWHEGYHHGQIKLALKAAGTPFEDEAIGRVTWGVWMDKTRKA